MGVEIGLASIDHVCAFQNIEDIPLLRKKITPIGLVITSIPRKKFNVPKSMTVLVPSTKPYR